MFSKLSENEWTFKIYYQCEVSIPCVITQIHSIINKKNEATNLSPHTQNQKNKLFKPHSAVVDATIQNPSLKGSPLLGPYVQILRIDRIDQLTYSLKWKTDIPYAEVRNNPAT